MTACHSCPSTEWMVGQSFFCSLGLLFVFGFLWWSGKQKVKNSNRKLRDVFLCHLKIIMGFFQITAGMMEAYAFIKWPKYLADIAKYADLIQLNVLRIAPMECINVNIYPFESMVIMLAVNAFVVAAAVIAYLSVRVYLRRRRPACEEQQATLSEIRVTLYRYTILTLFVIYPGTCSSITRTIPCHTICQSVDDIYSQCPSYLRANYRIECNESYKKKKIFSFIALSYLLLYPTLAFVYLYKQFRKTDRKVKRRPTKTQDEPQNTDNITATQEIVEDETPLGGEDEEGEGRQSEARNDNTADNCDNTTDGDEQKTETLGRVDGAENIEGASAVDREDMTAGEPQRNAPDELSDVNNETVSSTPTPRTNIDQRINEIERVPVGEDNWDRIEVITTQERNERVGNAIVAKPELLRAMAFLYENYKPNAWYWELLETIRKVILVSCLTLVGSESRVYVGLGAIVAGLFAILYAGMDPMKTSFEDRLQLLTLCVTFINLMTGTILKIPREVSEDSYDPFLDSLVVDYILVMVNILVLFVVTGMLK